MNTDSKGRVVTEGRKGNEGETKKRKSPMAILTEAAFLMALALVIGLLLLQLLERRQPSTGVEKEKEIPVTKVDPGSVVEFTSAGEMRVVEPEYYLYEPKEDISTYELALMLPLFSGVSYGMGEWSSPEGAIVPIQGRMKGGMPVGGTVLSLGTWDLENMGTAVRHFRKLEVEER